MGEFFPRPRDAGFGAVGGIHVAADLDLQVLERRAELGLEEEIQDLAPLRLGVVDQQARRGPRAQRPLAFIGMGRLPGIEHELVGAAADCAAQRTAQHEDQQGASHVRGPRNQSGFGVPLLACPAVRLGIRGATAGLSSSAGTYVVSVAERALLSS